jgi:hypothetical protein
VKLPESYEAWYHCLTVRCGVVLTPAYLDARLAALEDVTAPETRRFTELYGQAHRLRVLGWFARAKLELAGEPSGGYNPPSKEP